MIRVNTGEYFPILVSLVDEASGTNASGEVVYYDIRHDDDSILTPPVSGTLTESTTEPGIYRTTISLPDPGEYIIYASCEDSDYLSNIEGVIVNPENIYTLVKQTRQYNLSVEDILRTNVSGTASQILRNVDVGQTDYLINRMKRDNEFDWNGATVASGSVYAWYRTLEDDIPYKMSDDGV